MVSLNDSLSYNSPLGLKKWKKAYRESLRIDRHRVTPGKNIEVMKIAGTYSGIETCEGNPQTGRCGTEVCFSLLFRYAGPIDPFAPTGDGLCGSEGPGGEAKAAATKPACHASRDGISGVCFGPFG